MLEKIYCVNVFHRGGPLSEHSWSSYCFFSPVWCCLRRDMTLVKYLFDNIWWFRERWSSFCFSSARSWLRQDRYFLIISDDIKNLFLFFPFLMLFETGHDTYQGAPLTLCTYPARYCIKLMMSIWHWWWFYEDGAHSKHKSAMDLWWSTARQILAA